MLNVWCGPLAESMQINTVLIVQKTSKGDVSGSTACTPLGSTCIILTGGKITIRLTVPGLITPNCLSCPVCLLNHILCLYIAYLYILCTCPFPYSALYIISTSYSPYLQHNLILFLYLLVWSTTLLYNIFISSPVWPFLIKNSGTMVITVKFDLKII